MKKILFVSFICLIVKSGAQNTALFHKVDKILSDNSLYFKKGCPISKLDPTVEYFIIISDTIAYLPYVSKVRIDYEIKKMDSLDKAIHNKPIIPTLRIGRTKKNDYKKEEKELIIKHGIAWYIEDSLTKYPVNKSYDFKLSVYFDVNCEGEIYNVTFKKEMLNQSEIFGNGYIEFIGSVQNVLINIPKINPGMAKGKNVNSGRYGIEIRSNKDKYICSIQKY